MQKTRLLLAVAGLLCAAPLAAQQKRPLTVEDFDQWRAVDGATLSPDGAWAVYSLVPQVGDGELVVRRAPSGPEFRHTRGFIGRPQTQAGARPGSGYNAPDAQVSADSRHVVFTIDPPREEVERARRQRRRGADVPRSSLGIMRLPEGRVTVIPRVRSFRMARESGRFVAYLVDRDTTAAAAPAADTAARPAAAAASTPGGTARPVSADTTRRDTRRRKETGSTLVLRELATGAETRIEDVTGYTLDEGGRWLGYTVSSRDGRSDGAYVRSLADGRTHALLTGEGNYKALVFDRAGTQAAFVSDREEFARRTPRYDLYHAPLRQPRARRVAGPTGAAPVLVSDRAALRFTRDGGTLVFGTAPAPLDSVPADSLADKAVFDLWHYGDTRLQPQQRVEAAQERERTHLAVYPVRGGRARVIGSDTLRRVVLSEDGRVALATTTLPYSLESMWGEGGTDAYVVDPRTGARRLVARRLPFTPTLSADGRFVLYFGRDRHWHAYEVASGRSRDLTGRLAGVRFDQETWDTPDPPSPYGTGGWTEGDRSVLLYDRYDVWEVDPTGARAPRMVTDSVGRRGRIVFRVVDLDPDEASLAPAGPLLLRAFNDDTKASGYWRDRLGAAAAPVRLVMGDEQFGTPARARRADVFLFTRSTASRAPDLWVSGPQFADPVRVSEANPQQSRYRWTDAELVRWRSADGVELKGILYKPEDFDPTKKYPMVVYFYEQHSDELHQYQMNVPRNIVQPTLYASNGYLALFTDIHYIPGSPGESALRSVVPAVQSLIDRGIVDPARVGIQGQSWGGYQAAYIITRTPMFRAAMTGAPVANMTSAYGGIRWETGIARPFQYERGQSRIGASLWEQPDRYVQNSPLFAADRITTPLFIMHNDADGSVPWYQGIEMYVAMRRLGKEVYMVNYNGESHNPTKRANQLDVAKRMLQFFDHHLRGAPAPAWMREGIPFLQKGRDQLASPPAEVRTNAEPAPATTTTPGVQP